MSPIFLLHVLICFKVLYVFLGAKNVPEHVSEICAEFWKSSFNLNYVGAHFGAHFGGHWPKFWARILATKNWRRLLYAYVLGFEGHNRTCTETLVTSVAIWIKRWKLLYTLAW